jgi:hypothetical protein
MIKCSIDQIEFVQSQEVPGIYYQPLYHNTNDWADSSVPFTCITKFDPDISYPKINLLGPVEYQVLEGELSINNEVCSKGDFVRIEDGDVAGKAGPSGCLVLCSYKNGLKTIS